MEEHLPESALATLPYYKRIVKAFLQKQMNFLVEQMSEEVGEECVLMAVNLQSQKISHLGSNTGKAFLDERNDLTSQFMAYCIENKDPKFTGNKETSKNKKAKTNKRKSKLCSRPNKAKSQRTSRQSNTTSTDTNTVVPRRSRSTSKSNQIQLDKNKSHRPDVSDTKYTRLSNEDIKDAVEINNVEPQHLRNVNKTRHFNKDAIHNSDISDTKAVQSDDGDDDDDDDDGDGDDDDDDMGEDMGYEIMENGESTDEDETCETDLPPSMIDNVKLEDRDMTEKGDGAKGKDNVNSNKEISCPGTSVSENDKESNKKDGTSRKDSVKSSKEISNEVTVVSEIDKETYKQLDTELVDAFEVKIEVVADEDLAVNPINDPIKDPIKIEPLSDTVDTLEHAKDASELSHSSNTAGPSRGNKQKPGMVDNSEGVNESYTGTPLTCEICGYSTSKQFNLKRHMKVHVTDPTSDSIASENINLCGECGKLFKSVTGLQHHEKNVHRNVFSYTCPTCGKGYNGLANYRGHLALHDPALREKCTICEKTFTYRKSLLIHRKRCGKTDVDLRRVPCLQCGREFASQDTMKQHENVAHGNKTYRCQKCAKTFTWRSGLAYHTKRCY